MHPESPPEFTAPDGEIIQTGPDTRFRGNVYTLTARNRSEGLRIDPKTTIPAWLGERMDDSMAVEGLLRNQTGLPKT